MDQTPSSQPDSRPKRGQSSNAIRFGMLLTLALVLLLVYTFLHEGGHALVGLYFGGMLLEFNINFWDLSAHVQMVGNFTQAQWAIQTIAGVLLPLLVWVAFILLVARRVEPMLEWVKLIVTAGVLNSLAPWVIGPFLYMQGRMTAGDDVTNFLDRSGANPVLVAMVFLALYAGGWGLYLLKADRPRELPTRLRASWDLPISPGEMRVFRLTAGLGLAVVAAALGIQIWAANQVGVDNPIRPPAGYQIVETIRLEERAYEDEVVARFQLEDVTEAGVFVLIEDVDTTYFDLALAGPGGFREGILHAEGYRAALDSARLEQPLEAGVYEVRLTAAQSPGVVSVYLKR